MTDTIQPPGIGLKAADRCLPLAGRYLTMNGPPVEEDRNWGAWFRLSLWLLAFGLAAVPWFLLR